MFYSVIKIRTIYGLHTWPTRTKIPKLSHVHVHHHTDHTHLYKITATVLKDSHFFLQNHREVYTECHCHALFLRSLLICCPGFLIIALPSSHCFFITFSTPACLLLMSSCVPIFGFVCEPKQCFTRTCGLTYSIKIGIKIKFK